jgi:hypothetical protein
MSEAGRDADGFYGIFDPEGASRTIRFVESPKMVPVTILMDIDSARQFAKEIELWGESLDAGRASFEVVETASEWNGGRNPWCIVKLGLIIKRPTTIEGEVVANALERAK